MIRTNKGKGKGRSDRRDEEEDRRRQQPEEDQEYTTVEDQCLGSEDTDGSTVSTGKRRDQSYNFTAAQERRLVDFF